MSSKKKRGRGRSKAAGDGGEPSDKTLNFNSSLSDCANGNDHSVSSSSSKKYIGKGSNMKVADTVLSSELPKDARRKHFVSEQSDELPRCLDKLDDLFKSYYANEGEFDLHCDCSILV